MSSTSVHFAQRRDNMIQRKKWEPSHVPTQKPAVWKDNVLDVSITIKSMPGTNQCPIWWAQSYNNKTGVMLRYRPRRVQIWLRITKVNNRWQKNGRFGQNRKTDENSVCSIDKGGERFHGKSCVWIKSFKLQWPHLFFQILVSKRLLHLSHSFIENIIYHLHITTQVRPCWQK